MLIYLYYTLFASFSLLIIPAYSLLFLPSIKSSASHFLHHSVYFCLTHPLSNSVTSPYVSHLSPPPPLLCCQMPMIHIGSVYTSCCSSPSSHPHILTSSSHTPPTPLSFPLLISSSSSFTVFFLPLLPCYQITVFSADTFITVRPVEQEEGATSIHVTLSLPLHPSVWVPPILFFSTAASKIHHFLHCCQQNHLLPSLILCETLL